MNNSNRSYGNSSIGNVNLLGTGEGKGYVGPPIHSYSKNDVSTVFNQNTIDKLQKRKFHLDYWLRMTQ